MKGKVVIVTGASSGIGLACCEVFAGQGAQIVMAARNAEKLQMAAQRVSAIGGEVVAVPADVSRPADCQALVQAAVERFGRIDVLINNAGISMRALFADVDLEVLHRLMDTNFWGAVYCTHYALPYLLQSHGSVVGVSSVAGLIGLPARTGDSASKFALGGFLKTLRGEHLHTGLHVMIAIPGFTASNIRVTALGPDGQMQGETPREEQQMMTAETVAKHILRGVERRKRAVVLTFEGKMADFLRRICPAWLDGLQYRFMKREPGSPLQ